MMKRCVIVGGADISNKDICGDDQGDENDRLPDDGCRHLEKERKRTKCRDAEKDEKGEVGVFTVATAKVGCLQRCFHFGRSWSWR